MKIVVYIKTPPYSDWKRYAVVDTYGEARKIYNILNARGYYAKYEEEEG